ARMIGAEHLYFYDAISPIVLAETIDRSRVFRASRWDRSLRSSLRLRQGYGGPPKREARRLVDKLRTTESSNAGGEPVEPRAAACGVDDGEGDYLNCPFTREEYDRFY